MRTGGGRNDFGTLGWIDSQDRQDCTGFCIHRGARIQPPRLSSVQRCQANRILRWDAGTVKPFREKSNGANGLTFDHQGRLLTCEQDRVTRTEKDGSITVLATAFEGARLTSPNDLVYAIDGSIYFSVIQRAGAQLRTIRACIRSRAKANCGWQLGNALVQTA